MWYPGSGVVFVVSIPDRCRLSYFYETFIELKRVKEGLYTYALSTMVAHDRALLLI